MSQIKGLTHAVQFEQLPPEVVHRDGSGHRFPQHIDLPDMEGGEGRERGGVGCDGIVADADAVVVVGVVAGGTAGGDEGNDRIDRYTLY